MYIVGVSLDIGILDKPKSSPSPREKKESRDIRSVQNTSPQLGHDAGIAVTGPLRVKGL